MQKAIIYCRKSSESSEKQNQSNEDQLYTIKKYIDKNPEFNFSIVETYQESKSALKPSFDYEKNRPYREHFIEMVKLCRCKKVDVIICWSLSRLSRNPGDAGVIMELIQKFEIKIHTVTDSRIHDKESNPEQWMYFMIANQESINKSNDTRRGVNKKIREGHAPTFALPGYRNTPELKQGKRKILIDTEHNRFSTMREIFEEFMTGTHSTASITEWADKTKHFKKRNGKPISKTQMSNYLKNRFYLGEFVYGGNLHKGDHEPMLTEKEHMRILHILGDRSYLRPNKNESIYNGLIVCGSCGGAFVMDEKWVKNCRNCRNRYNSKKRSACPKCNHLQGEDTEHYHCYIKCGKKCGEKQISIKEFENQFDQFLETLIIPPNIIKWGVDEMLEKEKRNNSQREEEIKKFSKQISEKNRQLTNLRKKWFTSDKEGNELLSNEEYLLFKKEIEAELNELSEDFRAVNEESVNWINNFTNELNLISLASEKLKTGTRQEKRKLISYFISNLTIKDGKVTIDPTKRIFFIRKTGLSKISSWFFGFF